MAGSNSQYANVGSGGRSCQVPMLTRNVCINPLGKSRAFIGATVANTIVHLLNANHKPACIACQIHSIYSMKVDVRAIQALQQNDWEYTNMPVPICGIYYAGEEIPIGILKQAAELQREGYHVEFLTEHFQCKYYPVKFSLAFLAEALQDCFEDRDRRTTQSGGRDRMNAVDDVRPALEDPPPYQSASPVASDIETESIDNMGPSGALRASRRPAFPLPPMRNRPQTRVSRVREVFSDDTGGWDNAKLDNIHVTDMEAEDADVEDVDDEDADNSDDWGDETYEPSETGDED
jgi:hypothetical protein